ncbi:MAG TPA: ester cyclase [Candidatus Limnocylindria bacterium]|nr:ester cyclase [Candidatus Limnocylindria bacterium]
MSDENRALVERFYAEVISGGNVDALDELMAPDFVEHGAPAGLPAGREGFKEFVRVLRTGFPDFRWSVDDWIVAGDKVVARGGGKGTHLGDFLGASPTGRPASWTAIHIFRVQGGRLTERWSEVDVGGLLERLREP